MTRPNLEELLEVIAELEDFQATLARFPGLDRDALLALLGHRARPTRKPPAARASSSASPSHETRAPAAGLVLVWSDGASRGNPGPASVGVVLQDEGGAVIGEIAERIGIRTNNYAEYEAVRRGLTRAAELGARSVQLRADSELVIKQLNGLYRVKNEALIPLFEAVKALERRFPGGVRYQHVRREQNVEADRLANLALDNG